MLQQFLEMLVIAAVSATKNFTGIALAVYYSFGFWVSLGLTVGGGMVGAAVFTYFGDWFMNFLTRWYDVKKKIDHFRTKNKFTKFLISGYGLTAVAVLTPVFFSVPIGAFLAIAMEKNRRKILLFMLPGFIFWAVLLLGISHLLGINPQAWVNNLWENW